MASHNFNLYIDSSTFKTKTYEQIKTSAIQVCSTLAEALRAKEKVDKVLAENETKKFDWDTYKQNNYRAVYAVADHYRAKGYQVTIEPFGQYDIDLQIMDKNGIVWYLEPEVIKKWDGTDTTDYMYHWLHVLSRKWHFRDLEHSFNVTVHNKLLYAYLTPYSLLTDTYLANKHMDQIPNCYCSDPKGEWMGLVDWRNKSRLVVL